MCYQSDKQTLAVAFGNLLVQYNNLMNMASPVISPSKVYSQITALCKEFMPSGSGFDCGTSFDMNASTINKLVFVTSFHHMSEHGTYTNWTEHNVTVTPSFIGGFDIKVSGRNHNNIKDYIGDTFHTALSVQKTMPEWQFYI